MDAKIFGKFADVIRPISGRGISNLGSSICVECAENLCSVIEKATQIERTYLDSAVEDKLFLSRSASKSPIRSSGSPERDNTYTCIDEMKVISDKSTFRHIRATEIWISFQGLAG